jgi:hypothetical protein
MRRSTQCIPVVTILLLGWSGGSGPAHAEPELRTCGGILHSAKFGLHFGRGKGEEEFICAIAKSETQKVLARCRVGAYCEVDGLADFCPDSGECIEISRVTAVRAKPK